MSKPPANRYLVFTKGAGLITSGVLAVETGTEEILDHLFVGAEWRVERSAESCLRRLRLVFVLEARLAEDRADR